MTTPDALPDYSPDALRALLKRHQLTGAAAGRLLDVEGRQVRRWTADPSVASHKAMPRASWWLLLLLTGEATVPQVLAAAEGCRRPASADF